MSENEQPFDPSSPEYKTTEDLPKEHKEEFVDVPEGGFVRKEAAEVKSEADQIAAIAEALKEQGITGADVLHGRANERNDVLAGKLALKDASPELRNDREFMLEAMERQRGGALEYASPELLADREFILEAIKEDFHALEYASPELLADREFILEAVKLNVGVLEVVPQLAADREFMLKAVEQFGYALSYASPDLKNDPQVVFAAVRQNPGALRCASSDIRAEVEKALGGK